MLTLTSSRPIPSKIAASTAVENAELDISAPDARSAMKDIVYERETDPSVVVVVVVSGVKPAAIISSSVQWRYILAGVADQPSEDTSLSQ